VNSVTAGAQLRTCTAGATKMMTQATTSLKEQATNKQQGRMATLQPKTPQTQHGNERTAQQAGHRNTGTQGTSHGQNRQTTQQATKEPKAPAKQGKQPKQRRRATNQTRQTQQRQAKGVRRTQRRNKAPRNNEATNPKRHRTQAQTTRDRAVKNNLLHTSQLNTRHRKTTGHRTRTAQTPETTQHTERGVGQGERTTEYREANTQERVKVG